MWERFIVWALSHLEDLPKLFTLINDFISAPIAEKGRVFGELMAFLYDVLSDFPDVITLSEEECGMKVQAITSQGITREQLELIFNIIKQLLPLIGFLGQRSVDNPLPPTVGPS